MADNQGILINLKGQSAIASYRPKRYEWLEGHDALRLWLDDGEQITIRPGQYALEIYEPVTEDP